MERTSSCEDAGGQKSAKDAHYFYRLSIFLAGGEARFKLIRECADLLVARRGLPEEMKFLSEMKQGAAEPDIDKLRDIGLSDQQFYHGSNGRETR